MKTVALKDVCRITNGGTPKSGVEAYWHGGVAWLTPAEMGKCQSPYIAQTVRTISQEGLANCSAKLISSGSVILSTRAPIGHLAINETPMAFNQGCRGLSPCDKLDTKFLYYFLYYSRDALDALGTGTTFKELSSSNLANFQMPLPPLDEQRRIVAVLDKAFAGIATATANAQKNLTNARALFESYLKAALGAQKEGWVKRSLGSFCEIYQPKTISKADMRDDGAYPVFGANGVIGRYHRFNHEHRQLLVTCRGATCGSLNFSAPRSWITGNAMVVSPEPGSISIDLLKRIFEGSFNFADVITGAAQPQITRQSLAPAEVAYPTDANEQQQLELAIDTLHEKVARLETCYVNKLAALAELKQSLLQKAFSGELI